MKKKLTKIVLGCMTAVLAGTAGLVMAAPMESVIGLDVHNSGAFMSALKNYYETDESRDGNVAIWRVTFSGESEISHLAIGNYEGYEDYEKTTSDRNSNPAWRAFVGSLGDVLDVKSRLMAIERYRVGAGWRDHGAMAAFVMTITDPAAYAAAFAEFVESSDNPGSVRLMELRFGGQGATHAVLISAVGSAALNEYLDELLSSDAYRVFVGKVGDIRTILNVEMLSRVVTYGK